jgi:hypothetical protein
MKNLSIVATLLGLATAALRLRLKSIVDNCNVSRYIVNGTRELPTIHRRHAS